MATEKKTTPQQAIAAFERSCDELARQVNNRLFDGSRSWYWVADVVGGICDFGDTDFLTPKEMSVILQTPHFTYDQYAEWRDANILHADTKGHIRLFSWTEGCRHDMTKPHTQWKSVSEMLPPVDEEVIAIDRIGRITFAHIVDKATAIDHDGWNIPGIAFWMPYTPNGEMKEFYK